MRDLISTADATGDPELVQRLAALRARLTHTIAAAVVALDAQPRARWARVTTNKPRSVTQPEPVLDADPRFELGSVTKGLTGMLLADAIERGELTLDRTAGEILAARPELAARTQGPLHTVTIRELATHTSGLPRLPRGAGTAGRALRLALLGMDPYRGHSDERVLELAAAQELRGRGEYRYSNLGGAVAGQLVAIAAGNRYAALLRERILTPLRMSGTTVAVKGDSARRGRSGSGMSRQAWVLDGYAPAGGVIATIQDVARLTEALVAGSAPGIASLEPLGPATGMFWAIEPPLTWHNGATGGYAAFLGLLRDEHRGAAVLIDASRAPEARRVAQALLATDLGGG